MSDNRYWDEATERAYWDACAQEEAAMHEKDDELITRGEARNLAYEIFNHFMYADFLEITPADIYKKVDAIPAVPRETTAVEYLQTMRPICEDGRNCGKCPLSYNNNGEGINCQDYAAYYPEKAVAAVEAWARERSEE